MLTDFSVIRLFNDSNGHRVVFNPRSYLYLSYRFDLERLVKSGFLVVSKVGSNYQYLLIKKYNHGKNETKKKCFTYSASFGVVPQSCRKVYISACSPCTGSSSPTSIHQNYESGTRKGSLYLSSGK